MAYPPQSDVRLGVAYGPTNTEYTGTMISPTEIQIAAAVLAALQATAIPVNIKQVNSVPIKGAGVTGNTWGPV